MRYVCKNPPGGGGGERNPYQLIDYMPDKIFMLNSKKMHIEKQVQLP